VTLLLDTCAAIWIVANSRLTPDAEDALDDARDSRATVFVSPITAWEVGLLSVKGRFASPHPPKTWFSLLMAIDTFRLADLTPAIFIDSSFLPGQPPRDPADRIIIATARENDLTILTRDRLILEYAKAGNVRALAC
jgi:PIN domain nuclease of toxin-antitoxin system